MSAAGAPSSVAGGPTLTELSHPANSYFVNIKADAVTAIRVALDRLNVELRIKGASRSVSLWELVEGGCQPLSTRFAEFVGYVLIQARSSTGVSALYVSQHAIQTNAIQARVSLQRLVHMATVYLNRVGKPDFENVNLEGAAKNRKTTIDAAEEVHAADVGGSSQLSYAQPQLWSAISPWGWTVAKRL